jgi:hypothetical protein
MPSPAARNGARADHGGLGVSWDATGAQRPPSEPSVAPDEVARRRAEHERAERERLRRRHFDNEQIRRDVKRELDLRELVDPPDAETRRVRLTKASDFKIKAVRWVWAGRMPMGEITLIPGREGVGKSTFLAWLAAKLTKGELPGVWDGTKRAVLYAATEDSWEHTIAPRMLAAGADMDLVYRVDVQVVEGKYGKLLLPTDVMELTTAALDVEAAALMCDPVISVLADRINTFKAQELRSALEPLRMAAERAELAVAGLVHFNKGKDTDVLTSVSGSRAWTEVARAVVAIAKDPDADEYTCVVSQVKNNLGRSDLPHLAYTIGSATVETHDGGETEVGRLRWTSDGYARGVEDILNPPKEKKRSELHQKVIDFVIETEEETGRAVSTGEVIRRFGGATSEGNLKQILSRFARDGVLRRTDRGLYGAPGDGDEAVRRCPGPCDGTKLGQDENFCANCRKRLDRESAAESSQDTLY